MTFWIISVGLALVVAGMLAAALRAAGRRAQEGPSAAYDLKVYRDQLREVERDVARGVVEDGDAERVRTEISRRILAADAAMQNDPEQSGGKQGTSPVVMLVIAVVLVGGSLVLYRSLGAPGYGDLALRDRIDLAAEARASRPGQIEAESAMPAFTPPADASPDYIALVERLRDTVAQRPDDLQGHLLLAQNEANLGNFAAAARAQSQVLRLKGTEATAADFTDYADLLVLAAGGYVSPEAEAALSEALARDSTNGTARYYLGLMMSQTGRPDTAFRLWDQLLRDGPAEAPWIDPILAQIEDMALRAGVKYRIPDIGTGRGPTAEDMEAAQALSPAERMQMIEGMVSGLSDRLATAGGPVEDWAQLITALGVLGQTDQARAVYENAVQVFDGDTRALDLLRRAGQRAQAAE